MRSASAVFRLPAGFTLVEVVVAMAIVGLGIVTLLEIFSLGLRLGARSTSRTEAIAYGRRVMDEVFTRRSLREGTEQGSFSDNNRWRLEVRRAGEDARSLGSSDEWEMKEIALDVLASEGGKEKTVTLKSLRLVRKERP